MRAAIPVLACLLAGTAGCTHDQLLGTAYNIGRQHACKQAAEHTPNESMEEFRCMTEPDARGGQSFEEYKQAREEELGPRTN